MKGYHFILLGLVGFAAGFVAIYYLTIEPPERIDPVCDAKVIYQGDQGLWSAIASKRGLSAGPANKIRPLEGNGISLISTFSKRPASGGKTGGVRFKIDAGTERRIAGKKVLMKVVVCAGRVKKGQKLGMAYSTAQVGNSGWKLFKLNKGRASYCMPYTVPNPADKGRKFNGSDFLGVLSDADGKGGEVNLYEASIYNEGEHTGEKCIYPLNARK